MIVIKQLRTRGQKSERAHAHHPRRSRGARVARLSRGLFGQCVRKVSRSSNSNWLLTKIYNLESAGVFLCVSETMVRNQINFETIRNACLVADALDEHVRIGVITNFIDSRLSEYKLLFDISQVLKILV